MKRSPRNIAIAIFAGWLLAGTAGAEPSPAAAGKRSGGEKPAAAPSPTAAASASDDAIQRQLLDLPIPEGEPARGMKFPYRDLNGVLRMMLEAEVAVRVDKGHFEFDHMKVSTYDAAGQPEITITMPKSRLDVATQVIRSETPVEVRRADFLLQGSHLQFDTRARKGRFEGRVNMVIYNRKDL